jgi:hypothetical protein
MRDAISACIYRGDDRLQGFGSTDYSYGAPIVALAQRLTAVAETLRLSELVDFVVGSCLVGGRDTFADRLYLVDPGVSRVSGLEHGAIRAIEALPGTSCTRPE